MRSTVLDVQDALAQDSKAIWERLGAILDTVLDVSRPPLARLGRPKIDPEAVFGHPGRFPSASQHIPEMILSALNRPKSNFRWF